MLFYLPLLQSRLRYSGNLLGSQSQTDPKTIIYTVGGIVLFFIIVFFVNKYNNANGALKQHKRVFKKKAKELHLNKLQIKLLVNLLKKSDIKKPLMVLSHPTTLNSLLRKSIRDIKKEQISNSLKQNRITAIYRIKHHLDKYQKSSQIRNTHELKIGTKVVIERNDKKSYTTSVIGNYENFFCIKLPLDSVGNQIKWKRSSPIKLIAFDRSDKESHFLSKTLGINSIGKTNALLVAHTLKTTQNIARSFQRVDVSLSSYVYPVEKSFDKVHKKYIFKTNRGISRISKVLDISSGGCSMTMKVPFSEGKMIEMDFDLDDSNAIKLQGRVLKNRISRGRKITHVKFTRASATNLNKINNFIYGLG